MVRKHLQYYITTFPPNICTNLKCVYICRGSAVCLGCLWLFKSGKPLRDHSAAVSHSLRRILHTSGSAS